MMTCIQWAQLPTKNPQEQLTRSSSSNFIYIQRGPVKHTTNNDISLNSFSFIHTKHFSSLKVMNLLHSHFCSDLSYKDRNIHLSSI